MTKMQMREAILKAKTDKGITWAALAESLGVGEVWLASCGQGENPMPADMADKFVALLSLGPEIKAALIETPTKGWSMDKVVPTDPLMYRFYEILAVYGTTIKDVIEEKFGHGIMSAIDFRMDIDKESSPKGDRVVVRLNGKFLPYARW